MEMMALLKKIKNKLFFGSNYGPFTCPVCNKKDVGMAALPSHYFSDLQRYGHIHSIFLQETLNLQHYSCKNCFATDRDRLSALYLKKYLKDKAAVFLLDIAPSAPLANFLKKYKQVSYRSMDLLAKNVDDNLDITNMHSYMDEQFDFLICSHVLEHVGDDKKAISELYRVLKPGGKGIVMAPVNTGLATTLEDPLCNDIAVRWKLYGQDDHVRMYAKGDFISRLESIGFKVDMLDVKYFGADVFESAAVFPTSVLYVVNK